MKKTYTCQPTPFEKEGLGASHVESALIFSGTDLQLTAIM